MMKKEQITIQYRILRTLYFAITIVFALIGIYFNSTRTANGFGVFAYYTIQSNMLCIIAAFFYINALVKNSSNNIYCLPVIQGGIVMCIMLTFLVFHFLLLPTISKDSAILGPGNIYVHYIVPLMMLGDYVVFQQKGQFSFSMIKFWTLIPIVYCIFVYVYSGFGETFGSEQHFVPYFFLDYKRFGIAGVIGWIILLAIGFIALSCIFIIIDKMIVKFQKGKEHDE